MRKYIVSFLVVAALIGGAAFKSADAVINDGIAKRQAVLADI
jgi:hypothetical protein